jgi:GxxExxY protein
MIFIPFTAETQRTQRWRREERMHLQSSLASFNQLTERIIGAGIAVHRVLGPGLLESAYQQCFCQELFLRGIPFEREVPIPLEYRGIRLEAGYRLDILVAGKVVVEVKAMEAIAPIHEAQLLTYLRLGGWKVGLLMNFNVVVLKDGIRRRVLDLRE